jgi:FAD/FMN-containing dehydrogenase
LAAKTNANGMMRLDGRQRISGWGRYPVGEAMVSSPETLDATSMPRDGTLICRGEGRSYGDAAITSDGLVLRTTSANRLRHFDARTGTCVADAGLTFDELLRLVVPRGWFPPVTPGTKHVSIGGAVAADVHGKNHHRDGSFADHVHELELVLADGTTRRCSRDCDADLFWATVGGMGLTGVITEATFRLKPIETSLVRVQHERSPDLDSTFRWFDDEGRDDSYTVAWLDCLAPGRAMGRGILMRGHHATRDEAPDAALSVMSRRPYRLPALLSVLLNRVSVAAFNELYYMIQGRRIDPFLVGYDPFFYPLDGVDGWNRLYGRRGFVQYQFMVPVRDGELCVRRVLDRVRRSSCPVFLAGLKRFGPGNQAPLSFPGEGYTLAMDLPMSGGPLLRLLDELDDIVLECGGRVYLAKDARLSSTRFRRMYPRLDEWMRIKRQVDPEDRFRSGLSERLGLTGTRHAVEA